MAEVTFRVVLPDTAPEVAVMTVEPTAKALASPDVASIVATVGVPDVQLTPLAKSAMWASLYVPVALNCSVKPFGVTGFDCVTVIDTRLMAGGAG